MINLVNNNMEEVKKEALQKLENAEDKKEAIIEVIEMLNTASHQDLIDELLVEQKELDSNANLKKELGLRNLSKEEIEFYEKLKDVKQAITLKQIDVIPTSIVNISLENVKKESELIKSGIISFAPANVKKWISAEKTGTFSWSKIDAKLTSQLGGSINGLDTELSKLYTILVIPKAIRELSYELIDKYFTAILNETLYDGIENGYLVGTGKEQPIGSYKNVDKVNESGVHTDKELIVIKDFSPKSLAPIKKKLCNNGKRKIDEIFIICNPADEADYVAPALYDREGRLVSSYKNISVITSTENPLGKALFTIPNKYTMGFSGFKIDEYNQTLALDDADLIIGKVYANGRAVDDSVAVPFDVTKLEEYVPTIRTEVINTVETKSIVEPTVEGA